MRATLLAAFTMACVSVGTVAFCDAGPAVADDPAAAASPTKATSPVPAASAPVPDDIPTLEPAPRLEMREFDPFKKRGTGTISGSLAAVPTRAFGSRKLTGQIVYIIPQTTYSQYVADLARESWLHFKTVTVDHGAYRWLGKFNDASTSEFKFSNLPAGTYLVFAELVDSKAAQEKPCIASYPGYDADGNPENVKVGVYCYGRILHDYLFLSGTAHVSDGESEVVKLTNVGEVVR